MWQKLHLARTITNHSFTRLLRRTSLEAVLAPRHRRIVRRFGAAARSRGAKRVLAALAQALGIDGPSLERTVSAFNSNARAGEDPESLPASDRDRAVDRAHARLQGRVDPLPAQGGRGLRTHVS